LVANNVDGSAGVTMIFDTEAVGVRGDQPEEVRIFGSFGRTVYALIFETRDFSCALSVLSG
jgi:hypothetical protein